MSRASKLLSLMEADKIMTGRVAKLDMRNGYATIKSSGKDYVVSLAGPALTVGAGSGVNASPRVGDTVKFKLVYSSDDSGPSPYDDEYTAELIY